MSKSQNNFDKLKLFFIFLDLASGTSKVDEQCQNEQRLSNDEPRKTVST